MRKIPRYFDIFNSIVLCVLFSLSSNYRNIPLILSIVLFDFRLIVLALCKKLRSRLDFRAVSVINIYLYFSLSLRLKTAHFKQGRLVDNGDTELVGLGELRARLLARNDVGGLL